MTGGNSNVEDLKYNINDIFDNLESYSEEQLEEGIFMKISESFGYFNE